MRDEEPGILRPTSTRWSRVVVAWLSLVLLLLVLPRSATAAPIMLDGTSDHHSLFSRLDALVDPIGDRTIDDVASAELRPITEVDVRYGALLWMGSSIHVPPDAAESDDDWYLVIGHPYEPGTLYLEEDGAFRAVPIPLDPSGTSFVAELPRKPGLHRFFIRVRAYANGLPSLLHVATVAGHQRLEQRLLTHQGLYLGVIFAVLLVNLLTGLLLRDRAHLWYVAFVSVSAIYFSIFAGTFNRFVAPTVPAGSLFRPEMFFLTAMVITGVQFSRLFLDTPRTAPRWDRVMLGHLALSAAVLLPVWLAPASVAVRAVAIVGAVLPFVVVPAGVVAGRAGSRAARFYLVGWSLFTAGGFLFAVPGLPMLLGLPVSVFQLGSALEAAVLSLALVDRMRILREERLLMASARDRAELEAARSEKLAALGQLVAGVAHEVNNPNNFLTFNLPILEDYLAAVRPHVEAAAEKDPALRLYGLTVDEFFEDAAALIGNMKHGAQRIAGIVSQLRTYVRQDDEALWEEADVNGAVKDAATLVQNQLQKMVDRFEVQLGEGLPRIRMSTGRIEQVVMNLLLNAGHAAQPVDDGYVTVTTHREDGCVVIAVEDNGPGVPEDIRDRVFEPFFTTKQRAQGTGMGLAISKRIVDEHGGTLELSSEAGRPTRFVVRLPVLPGKS